MRQRRGLFITIALSACSTGPAGDPSSTVGEELTRTELPADIDMTCEQVVLILPVDANVAATYIPAGRQLSVDQQGAAQVWVPVKRCTHFSAGDTEYGPLDFAPVWLLVQGAFEVNPVPGMAATLPTVYVEYLRTYFDSVEFFRDMKRLGLKIELAHAMSIGVPGDPGHVGEHGVEGFSWQENVLTSPEPPVGIRIVAYRDHDRTPNIEHITCAMYDSVTGQTMVSVDRSSSLAPFGSTLFGGTFDASVQCTAVFQAQ